MIAGSLEMPYPSRTPAIAYSLVNALSRIKRPGTSNHPFGFLSRKQVSGRIIRITEKNHVDIFRYLLCKVHGQREAVRFRGLHILDLTPNGFQCLCVLRKGRCGEKYLAQFQHRRQSVKYIRRTVAAVQKIRIDAFSRTNRLPRGAAKRVGILRAVIHSAVHGRAYRVRYAERIDVRGQVERREAVAVDVGLDVAAVDIIKHFFILSNASFLSRIAS